MLTFFYIILLKIFIPVARENNLYKQENYFIINVSAVLNCEGFLVMSLFFKYKTKCHYFNVNPVFRLC